MYMYMVDIKKDHSYSIHPYLFRLARWCHIRRKYFLRKNNNNTHNSHKLPYNISCNTMTNNALKCCQNQYKLMPHQSIFIGRSVDMWYLYYLWPFIKSHCRIIAFLSDEILTNSLNFLQIYYWYPKKELK